MEETPGSHQACRPLSGRFGAVLAPADLRVATRKKQSSPSHPRHFLWVRLGFSPLSEIAQTVASLSVLAACGDSGDFSSEPDVIAPTLQGHLIQFPSWPLGGKGVPFPRALSPDLSIGSLLASETVTLPAEKSLQIPLESAAKAPMPSGVSLCH